MKELMRLRKNQVKRHSLIWVIVITYLNIVGPIPGTWAAKIIGSALIDLNYMLVFYGLSLFVFPAFWPSKRVYLFLGIIGCIMVYCANAWLIYLKIMPFLGGPAYYIDLELFPLFIDRLVYFLIAGALGTASFFYCYAIYNLKLQAEKEKALLVKELNFLKNQFNSHITFNFLNYCYSKVHKYSAEAAESIELFSDMLRYTLQTKPEEKVALSSEITYIENFISLQKLLGAKVYASFCYKGETGDKYILPRILVTFVENAFKHGQFNDPEYPIVIELTVEGNMLFFTTRNKVSPDKKAIGPHTGLENVTQILGLYYANQYELKKEGTGDFFGVELRMELTMN